MVPQVRIKSPWSQLALLIGLTGFAFILASFMTGLFYNLIGVPLSQMQKTNWNDQRLISSLKVLQALSSLVLFLLPTLLYALFTFNGRYGYFLGLRKAENGNMYVLAIICILLAFPCVLWLGQLNSSIHLPTELKNLEKEASDQMEAFLKVKGNTDVIINVIIIALLPAICEELYFRGALQRILIHITRSPLLGIILTAILFSALHLQFEGFLPRMFLGIILGIFYWYSGSLWTNILAHFVNNAFQVLMVSYDPKYINVNPDSPMLATIASGIAVSAILWYYRRQSTVTWTKVYRDPELTSYNQFMA